MVVPAEEFLWRNKLNGVNAAISHHPSTINKTSLK